MKKLIGLLATFAVAVTAIGVLNGATSTVSADSCTNGTSYKDFDGNYTGRDTMTVWTKGNKPLCKDVNVNFTSFTVHNNYNGQGFKNNPTALPQSSFYNRTITLKKGTNGKTTVKVQVPADCVDYQIDAYVGPAQTKITTNEGLVDTTAIVGKLFQRTKKVCEEKKVNVCDPKTGKIITVKESEAKNYKPVGDIACQPIKVCDLKTKKIVTIKTSEFDSSKYSKNLNDAACKPAPNKVNVCDPATGEIITVNEKDASKYKPVNDIACDEKPVEEVPQVLPSTGPADGLMAILGAGSLTGAAYTWIRSRRALR